VKKPLAPVLEPVTSCSVFNGMAGEPPAFAVAGPAVPARERIAAATAAVRSA